MAFISTTSISVILNGSPLKPIMMGKGLRQGDPLSPYIFILVSEALVFVVLKSTESGRDIPSRNLMQ